eukprot:g20897.t1
MSFEELWPEYEKKMKAGGKDQLPHARNTMIPESQLEPVATLPDLEALKITEDPGLLKETVVLKLNGGLGTGMGLDKAKSLLQVTDGNSFLDLIAKQVEWMKKTYNMPDLKFMLMNSFSTSADTLAALGKYSALGTGDDLEFVQNKAPKVTAKGPPGHGDLYPAMLGSGTLDRLLAKGVKYMFVSNSDNLGATLDLKLLTHFAQSGAPFLMEVAARTDADKKGGETGRLGESTWQRPPGHAPVAPDTSKYRYFNTNNLWVHLGKLKELFDQNAGALPLPVMKNDKMLGERVHKVFSLEN